MQYWAIGQYAKALEVNLKPMKSTGAYPIPPLPLSLSYCALQSRPAWPLNQSRPRATSRIRPHGLKIAEHKNSRTAKPSSPPRKPSGDKCRVHEEDPAKTAVIHFPAPPPLRAAAHPPPPSHNRRATKNRGPPPPPPRPPPPPPAPPPLPPPLHPPTNRPPPRAPPYLP